MIDDILTLVTDVGFPIAAALTSGYFIFLSIKFILAGVSSSIGDMADLITALDNRVRLMNNDVVRVDLLVSSALGLKPDTTRIARSDTTDARKD